MIIKRFVGGIKTINCAINTRDPQKQTEHKEKGILNRTITNSLTFITNIRYKRRITKNYRLKVKGIQIDV